MDSLEFECPLCNGLFNAAVADVEVTCPHCEEKICLGSVNSGSSTNVILVAKPIVTPDPLFPPGYKDPIATDSSALPKTVRQESLPVIIVDDDVTKFVAEAEPITPPKTVWQESLPVVIVDDDVAKIVTDAEPIIPPATVREVSLPVVIIDDDDSLVRADTDTAIDDLLPPGFQLDDLQIKLDTDLHGTTETAVAIDIQVDVEPITVGRGINKRELRSRTPDEKNQFMRKKNVIVWGIGALIIIVTMIVMLRFS